MRQVIDDGPDGELALHMKCRLEFARRKQESVHAPQIPPQDVDEEARAAFAAGEAGISLQFPSHRIAANDFHSIGGIHGFRRIGAPCTAWQSSQWQKNCTMGSAVISISTALQRHWTLVIRSAPIHDAAFANTRAMRLRQSAP